MFTKGTPKPKNSGRKKGGPNHATLEIKAFARSILEDKGYQARLKQRIISGKAPQVEQLLYAYAYGKPREATQDTAQDGTWVSRTDMKRAADKFTEKVKQALARQEENKETAWPKPAIH